ncbi:MAG: hypothetical protein K8M05_11955 [Deltaproteobacteria bacterium]|nr:hypothetical protein [Kofleriaceae bacterium]
MSRTLTFALVVLAAACGEDENILPSVDAPAVDVDASVDADPSPRPTAVVVTGDFSVTGVLSTIDVATGTVTPNALAGVAGGEPWIRRIGGELFIVNRAGGNNVTIVGGSPLGFVDQFGTGAGTNPQDVAVVGNKLYVPVFDGMGGLRVIDRTTRMITSVTIDVDPDDVPNCVSAYAVGDRVFVACDLFDANFVPRGPGKIAVIDTTDDSVETTFDLGSANPFGRFVRSPEGSMFGGDLLIPTVPDLRNYTNGCLERVSVGATPAANGCAVTNATLAAYVAAVDVAPDGATLWLAAIALNSDFSNNFGRLRPIDLSNGTLGAEISVTGQLISSVAACPGGHVVAADITFGASGIRIYRDGTEQTTAPLDVGRPVNGPNGIVCY